MHSIYLKTDKKDTFVGEPSGIKLRKENDCLLLGTSKGIAMNYKRMDSSSVVLNSSMLWIMGGTGSLGSEGSTEFVTTERTVNGPPLREPVTWHCSVIFPGNRNVYLIGGAKTQSTKEISTNKVWVANPSNEFTFAQGPSLITSRVMHMCGIMSIGAKSIIVAAGGWNLPGNDAPGIPLTSVEILNPLSNQWVAGEIVT